MTQIAGGSIHAILSLDSDHSVTNTTPTNAPGMAMGVAEDTAYVVGLIGSFTSSATTVGIGLLLTAPPGSKVMGLGYHLGSTAQTMTVAEQVASGALTNAGTIGVRAANQELPVLGWWLVVVGPTPGMIQLQVKAEVNGTVVLKAQTGMVVWSA